MKLWRKALSEVRSSSQLAMCLQQLQKSIAWERSIMKVVSDVINFTVHNCRNAHLLCIYSISYMSVCVFSTVRCAERGIMKTCCCCVMAVIRGVTPIATNPR